jgi:hypothetical protein
MLLFLLVPQTHASSQEDVELFRPQLLLAASKLFKAVGYLDTRRMEKFRLYLLLKAEMIVRATVGII